MTVPAAPSNTGQIGPTTNYHWFRQGLGRVLDLNTPSPRDAVSLTAELVWVATTSWHGWYIYPTAKLQPEGGGGTHYEGDVKEVNPGDELIIDFQGFNCVAETCALWRISMVDVTAGIESVLDVNNISGAKVDYVVPVEWTSTGYLLCEAVPGAPIDFSTYIYNQGNDLVYPSSWVQSQGETGQFPCPDFVFSIMSPSSENVDPSKNAIHATINYSN